MTHKKIYFFFRFTQGDAKAVSKALLEEALTAFWQRSGEEPEEIVRTEGGKPYFPSGRFHLSVTHTGNLYAAVFSPVPIGIDAERADEMRERIAEKKFSREERALPFSFVWCAKEAVAKLVGKGLGSIGQISLADSYAEYEGKRYFLREEILGGTYRLVIATEEGWDYDGAETLSEK